MNTTLELHKTSLETPYGTLIPLFHVEDMGRRRESPVIYFPEGGVRSLPLQERTDIHTSVGLLPAERLTFYKTGELRRIFPSDGKLSGFWTEEHEYAEAPLCEFKMGYRVIRAKLISIQFYKKGTVQSFTLWPQERLTLETPVGSLRIRVGASYYPNGRLKTLEPASPTRIPTPIGIVAAYDPQPLGIHADVNSVGFDLQGRVESLKTVSHGVKVYPSDGEPLFFVPRTLPSYCDEMDATREPLSIRFASQRFFLGQGGSEHSFSLEGTETEVVLV